MTTTDDRPDTEHVPAVPDGWETPPPALDQRAAAFVMGVLQTVRDESKARYDEARAIAARDYFYRGDSFAVVDPDTGTKVGAAGMTSPDPVATITDGTAFRAHLVHHHGHDQVMEETVMIAEGRGDEVLDVLREHAPHLLEVHLTPREATVRAALALALEIDPADDDGGRRRVPGVTVHVPEGVPFTRLTKAGKAHVRRRIAEGRLDALRALPPRPTPATVDAADATDDDAERAS